MPEYICKRISAAWYDLKNEDQEAFRAMKDYVRVMGKTGVLRDVVIINLILDLGAVKADDIIKRFIGRGFLTLDRLQGLIDGTDSRTFQANVNENPGKGRTGYSEAKTLGAMLPKSPEEFMQGKPVQIEKPPTRLKKGYFTRAMVNDFMAEHHPADLDLWEEFFTFAGVQPGLGEIYTKRKG